MTGYARHTLPADISVFAGAFDSQPLVFAHLMDVAPGLDLDHVEVILGDDPAARLGPYFPPDTVALLAAKARGAALVLVLPAAFEGLHCPFRETDRLSPLGTHRGTITRMIATGDRPE